MLAGTRPYSVFDQIANTLAFIGFSLPTFFTGLLLILVFSIQLDWLPFVYRADLNSTGWRFYWDHIRQSIMPVTVLGLFQGASLVRYVRSSVLEVMPPRLRHHGALQGHRRAQGDHQARGAQCADPGRYPGDAADAVVFGGAIVTEQIFRVPGIGSLLISSMLSNDTPVVMAVTFVFSCLVVLCNLIADILYAWLDPRISFR